MLFTKAPDDIHWWRGGIDPPWPWWCCSGEVMEGVAHDGSVGWNSAQELSIGWTGAHSFDAITTPIVNFVHCLYSCMFLNVLYSYDTNVTNGVMSMASNFSLWEC